MRSRTLLAALVAALALAPLATAQGSDPEAPDDRAWVEDCPPDMMCAFGGDVADEEEPSRDGGAPVCEHCRDAKDRPVSNQDPEDNAWVDCPEGAVCAMDGSAEDGREPSAERGALEDDVQRNAVPSLGLAAGLAALGAVALLRARRA